MFEETIETERHQSLSNSSLSMSPAPRSVERSVEWSVERSVERSVDLNRGRLDTTGSSNSGNTSPAAPGVVRRLSMQQQGRQGGQRYKIFV